MKYRIKLILLSVYLISSVFVLSAQDQKRPNVILILADDMGLADFSSMNGGLNRTPVLDRLREEGVWFPSAYSGSAVCAPARAALLTGKYPHRTGVVSLSMATEPEVTSLKTNEVTLADAFKENGYRTALVGKWHLGALPPFHPLKRGFEHTMNFVGFNLKTYYNFKLDENGTLKQYTGEYLDDVLTEKAINFVEGNKDEPFFLHLAYSAPHRPLGGPEVLIDHYRKKGFNEKTSKVYAMIEALDKGVGRLIKKLEDLGIRENTLIIFASDNGEDPGVGPRFNLEMKGTKYTVYEGGIHVPMLFNWPERFQPSEPKDIVSFTDIFPTLVEVCGLDISTKVKKDFDGVSILASLQGKNNQQLPETRFWQWNRHQPYYSHNAAIRMGDWKLVRPFTDLDNISKKSTLEPLLYNIKEDGSESKNLADKYPDKVKEMKKILEKWAKKVEKDRLKNPDFKNGELIIK